MAFNPSLSGEHINNATNRANDVNDPNFKNEQGYFPYDLTSTEVLTPLFGLATPSFCMETVPGDRIVMTDNTKLLLNRINGNFLSQINQYVDSFYVSLRNLYPTNFEKLIPNPTKGQDLPNAALPQVPINLFVQSYLFDDIRDYSLTNISTEDYETYVISDLMNGSFLDGGTPLSVNWSLARLLFLSTVFSRGQLLDYLGLQLDTNNVDFRNSKFQYDIDTFQRALYEYVVENSDYIREFDTSLTVDGAVFDNASSKHYDISTLELYRSAIADIFERGHLPYFVDEVGELPSSLVEAFIELVEDFRSIFATDLMPETYINSINTDSNPFHKGHISLMRPLAYQQVIAQYYSVNAVDNIFNSDLYMQLLRATMYPSVSGFSEEPTFTYNGVTTEYDYISAGGFYYALIYSRAGVANRQHTFMSLMFLHRRTLRYGDYFSTARPQMLAVGQLGIPVGENGMVSPIDVTRNLLVQRYLNAANYIGSGFLPYYASIFGVTPAESNPIPRYVAHRTIPLQAQITNNTADEQGKQTTNLVGYSDNTAFDVFIDDFGVLLNLVSFDCLPIYTSGIDSAFHLSDRFDFFNPMLQNIGDQPIYLSELIGNPALRDNIFGYTMRNKEYKFKISRAHGAFCNNSDGLAGFLMKYPVNVFYMDGRYKESLHIDSEFVRDKPYYLDPYIPVNTGVSPAEYFHFIVSAVNVVKTARKIQQAPPVLF